MKDPEIKNDLITKPASITQSTLSDFHFQLEKLVQLATCTKDNLTNEEKIAILIKKEVLPIFLPPLLGLSEQEVLAMMEKYKGKLAYDKKNGLADAHHLCFVVAKKTSLKLGSDYTTAFFNKDGWQKFVNLDQSNADTIRKSIFIASISFLNALLIDHKNVEGIIGTATTVFARKPNHLHNIEWLAKAYKIDPNATVKIIYEKNLLNFISNLLTEYVLSE